MTTPTPDADQPKGTIGRTYEDGKPVIYKFVNELPPAEPRSRLPWLTVITWEYDGDDNNGMPAEAEREGMINLEQAIDGIEADGAARHAYSRTGNDLKELVYYIHDQDQFMASFNQVLANHPRYPIEIEFYEDPDWEDLQELLEDFAGAPDAQTD